LNIILLVLLLGGFMLMPALPLLTSRLGRGSPEVEASFLRQQVPGTAGSIPATQLQVLLRVPGMTECSNTGSLMLLDTSWLCRAPDGRYLLALGQGMRSWKDSAGMPWNRKPLDIHWTWRTLTEAQARQFAGHDAAALRQIGSPPAGASEETGIPD
jgi:hypothetical protein